MTQTPTDALRLVPVEPTWDQLVAMRDCCAELSGIEADSETMLTALYRAALKAAPASPLPEGGGQCSGISGELSGWQNISTAPRNGDEFQAWWKGTWQPRARFDPEYGSFQLWGRTDYDTEGWEAFEIDGFWQPQPAAPTGDAK